MKVVRGMNWTVQIFSFSAVDGWGLVPETSIKKPRGRIWTGGAFFKLSLTSVALE